MVVLRLARRGTTHRPFYHIVAADSRARRDGRYLEQLGTYDPLGDTALQLDTDKVNKWVSVGAQQSPKVRELVKRATAAASAS